MRILVIEDDAQTRRTLERILRGMFHDASIVCVDSAGQAIAHLEQVGDAGMFDLVSSDFNLVGNHTGGDVLDWVRGHLPRLARRFMFVSGNDAARRYGVPYVEKPCDLASFRAAVRALLCL